MIIIFVLANILSPSWAEVRVVEPPIRVDLQPPESASNLSTRNVFQSWVTMPIDHFDPQNPDTFQMRFMFNEQFFDGPGHPIFIMVGGEWSIAPGWLLAGNMFQMANENHGYIIYTEHRYYGETLPYREFTAENLRFLNVDQALADLAYFILELKKQPRFANSKIILYGGSYAANMALWFKQRYPHLVEGVVASSGPIKGKVDFVGYLEVVHKAFLSEGGEQCISIIKQGIDDTITAMQTEVGRRSLEEAYRLCSPLNYDKPLDLGYFSGLITWSFSGAVQQARPGTLLAICNNFSTNAYGITPMQKIGGFIAAIQNMVSSCWSINFEIFLNTYNVTRSNSSSTAIADLLIFLMPANYGKFFQSDQKYPAMDFKKAYNDDLIDKVLISRAWYYQTCTEYGYFQTAPRSGTVFDQLKWLDVAFYAEICKQAYDQRFDEAFVYDAVERVNLIFGGLEPDVNNTINIHGTIDPWHALGVYDRDLKEGSPTYTVNRASHCFDMQGWLSTDTIKMTQAQQAARRLVAKWLSETK